MYGESCPNIKVIGIGSGGIKAINHMMASNLHGMAFIAADSDKQTLTTARSSQALQLAASCAQGAGYDAQAHTGDEAAMESVDAIKEAINRADLVFVVAGLSGEAGTGAAPVIAQTAKELGALTIGVVTKPVHFEDKRRLEIAEAGIEGLLNTVDCLIVIPCNGTVQLPAKRATCVDMLKIADEALHRVVRSISDVLLHKSLIPVDFTDIRAIFEGKGMGAMGFGATTGASRARDAALQAVSSPFWGEASLRDASAVWLNITGNQNISIDEISEVTEIVTGHIREDSPILFGTRFDDSLGDELRVTIVAAGVTDPDKPTSEKGCFTSCAIKIEHDKDIFFNEDDLKCHHSSSLNPLR